MGEMVLQLRSQSVELWQKLSRLQRIIIISSAIGIIFALIFFARGASQPDYVPLFGEKLSSDEAGAIVDKLKELKVTYNLSKEGDIIYVPANDVAETRLAIASDDKIPVGGVVGFEAFDNPSFGETETDRQAKFLRALQGELTRTIEQMDEVENARVHIVMPKETLFSDDEKAATAAIVLKMEPHKTLAEDQVRGLVKLVSSSVEGLDPKNVTIVDTNSNILTEALDFDETGANATRKLSATQMQIQQQKQKDIERSVQSMLERVLGPGKAVVRVSADLDFDDTKVSKQTVGKPVVVSKHELEEKTTNSGDPSGVPGTTTNSTDNTPSYPSTNTGNYYSEKTDTTINNELNKEVEETVKAPGDVKKLSVAVVLDGNLTTSQQKKMEGLVATAAGIDEERGDQVSVVGMPFDTSEMDEISKAMAADAKRQQTLIYTLIAIAILLPLGGILFHYLRKRSREQGEEETLEPVMTVEQLLAANAEQEPEPEPDPLTLERMRIKGEVEKTAKESPDEVARLLKTWLVEE